MIADHLHPAMIAAAKKKSADGVFAFRGTAALEFVSGMTGWKLVMIGAEGLIDDGIAETPGAGLCVDKGTGIQDHKESCGKFYH
jgi:hypothetical protein